MNTYQEKIKVGDFVRVSLIPGVAEPEGVVEEVTEDGLCVSFLKNRHVGQRVDPSAVTLLDPRKVIEGMIQSHSRNDFRHLCLNGMNFRSRNLDGTEFNGSALAGADFNSSVCNGANFAGADLTDARFLQTSLCYADFTGATLTGAMFHGANLFGVKGLQHAEVSYLCEGKYERLLCVIVDNTPTYFWEQTGDVTTRFQGHADAIGAYFQRLPHACRMNALRAIRFALPG